MCVHVWGGVLAKMSVGEHNTILGNSVSKGLILVLHLLHSP